MPSGHSISPYGEFSQQISHHPLDGDGQKLSRETGVQISPYGEINAGFPINMQVRSKRTLRGKMLCEFPYVGKFGGQFPVVCDGSPWSLSADH